MKTEYKDNKIIIPVEIGDIMLTGRFRNKPVKVEEPEYRSLSYSMENDLIANAPSECEPR